VGCRAAEPSALHLLTAEPEKEDGVLQLRVHLTWNPTPFLVGSENSFWECSQQHLGGEGQAARRLGSSLVLLVPWTGWDRRQAPRPGVVPLALAFPTPGLWFGQTSCAGLASPESWEDRSLVCVA
jgi:hypothetical protein